MRTPSLTRRVIVAGVAVLAVLIVGANVVVYSLLRIQLEQTLEDTLETRASLAQQLGIALDAQALADRLTQLGVPAVVTARDGAEHAARPAVTRTGDGPPADPSLSSEPRAELRVPLRDGGQVTVFASRAGVDTTLNRLAALLAATTLAAVLGAVLMLRRSATVALRPLGEVVATARRTAAGHTGERLRPDDPASELGRMAAAFDEMLDALEAALAEARASEEVTRRFLDDAAHQLRTPIAAVRMGAELLLTETDPAERDRVIAHVVRETARAGHLISALLRLARLDQGSVPAARPTDLAALCASEAARWGDLSPGVEFAVDLSAAVADVTVAPEEVSEAIGNLLDNARRYARSRVDLTLQAADGGVEVVVRDDGPGIASGDVERAFERFVTLDSRSGSGLGLAIARAVARSQGGDLTYEDGAFVLRLPAAAADLR